MTTLKERRTDLNMTDVGGHTPQVKQRPVNTKRVVCISDVHEKQLQVKIPACDILVVSGDLTYTGVFAKVTDFNNWCYCLQNDGIVGEVVVIAGNHDLTAQSDADTFKALLPDVLYLCDEEVTVKGLRIYGSPWTPTFGRGWAFNADRGHEIKEHWDKIPTGLDILITHGPPYGHGDVVASHKGVENEHVGCWDLREAVLAKNPRMHVFGHIHEGYGMSMLGNTVCVNASTCNYNYKPVNTPLVIDL